MPSDGASHSSRWRPDHSSESSRCCACDRFRRPDCSRADGGKRSGSKIPSLSHQPFGLRAASRHLLRCRSSAMSPHRLRRGASHLPARRSQRKQRDFRSATLASLAEDANFHVPIVDVDGDVLELINELFEVLGLDLRQIERHAVLVHRLVHSRTRLRRN